MRKPASATPISLKAQDILGELAKISGTDEAARAVAQALINPLAGERCTKKLITALKDFLKGNGWGVSCPKDGCGKSSGIHWQPDAACTEGGIMRYHHPDSTGKTNRHGGGTTTLPELVLVERSGGRPGRRAKPR